MDLAISLQDVANIIIFVVPGYFAIQVYSAVYAKRPREFSKLLLESIVFSVPIVATASFFWEDVFGQAAAEAPNVRFVLLVLAAAILSGLVAVYFRNRWPVKQIAARYGFDSPNEDFIKAQLARLGPTNSAVTVTLKDGSVFSGTPKRMSRYRHDSHQYFYFDDIARYDKEGGFWQEQPGGIIVERNEVQYMETPSLADD